MEFQKKVSVAGNFAKKGEDIKDGDRIKLLDGGTVVEGQFGPQNVFKIKTRSGEFLLSLNQTSINALIDEFGGESNNWIGKELSVTAVQQNVAGKFLKVYYVAPLGYEMGENGFEKNGMQGEGKNDVPTINLDDEIKLEDVPF